jgi:D-alanine-D-alanine ligase
MTRSQWWKTLFDEVYLLTDARSVCNPEATRQEIDVVSHVLDLGPQQSVLDLCGGHGRHSLELCRRGQLSVTLLDYSLPLLKQARAKAKRAGLALRILRSDARCTGLAASSFDTVLLLGNSLGYEQTTAADLEMLGECFRLLRPGGRIALDISDRRALEASFKPLSWHEPEKGIVVCREKGWRETVLVTREMVLSKDTGLIRDETYAMRLYTAEEIERLLQRAGFQELSTAPNPGVRRDGADYGCMTHRILALGRKPSA